MVTGSYFYHQRPRELHPAAHDSAFQDRLLDYCASLTGIALPVWQVGLLACQGED
jgi:hypothetical protein